MCNRTIKKFDITIKLRGDHVYDLYMNGEWVASRGHYRNIVEEIENLLDEFENSMKNSLLEA